MTGRFAPAAAALVWLALSVTGLPARAQDDVDARLKKMEAANAALQAQMQAILQQNADLTDQIRTLKDQLKPSDTPALPDPNPAPPANPGSPRTPPGGSIPRSPDDDQPPDIRTDQPRSKPKGVPLDSKFTEGFRWEDKDGEFQLQFHQETQVEMRAYQQAQSDPVNQVNLYPNRVRFFFNGRMTKPIEYSISFNKGYSTNFDLLDAYINFNYDKRFQFRLGRYRMPYTYEFYAIANQYLVTPERSIFAINSSYIRNTAAMLHGEILDGRAEYAVAVAAGPRNSYFDYNGRKDVLGFFNVRPFDNSERFKALQNLNIGASGGSGIQNNPAAPTIFRTSHNLVDSTAANKAIPSYLQFNSGVNEVGLRSLGEVHAAYYYKSLALIAGYDFGFETYSRSKGPEVRVPISAYHVTMGYFLTGEEQDLRGPVDPIHPFNLKRGERGLGAIELAARYSEWAMGNQIFTGGFADQSLWTNRVYATDLGFNWYLNRYVKVYFDWQHSVFGNPVQFKPGGLQLTSDLFWIRCQLYF